MNRPVFQPHVGTCPKKTFTSLLCGPERIRTGFLKSHFCLLSVVSLHFSINPFCKNLTSLCLSLRIYSRDSAGSNENSKQEILKSHCKRAGCLGQQNPRHTATLSICRFILSHTFEPHQISYDISAFYSSPDNWRSQTIRASQASKRSRFVNTRQKKEKKLFAIALNNQWRCFNKAPRQGRGNKKVWTFFGGATENQMNCWSRLCFLQFTLIYSQNVKNSMTCFREVESIQSWFFER